MTAETVMIARPGTRRITAVAAVVAWAAVILQFFLSLQLSVANGNGILRGIVVYFGYFTILSNILVALALSAPLVAPSSGAARFFTRPGVVTTIAAAITVVGIAYHFLLRQVWDPQGWQLVADVTLHYVTPLLFLGYWWATVPKGELRWDDIPRWLVYPLVYLIYVLVRGELTGLYPYHFIDVQQLGYGTALSNALAILVFFILVAGVLVAVSRLKGNQGRRARVAP